MLYLAPKLTWWSRIKLSISVMTGNWTPSIRFNNGVEFDLLSNRIILNNPTTIHATENFYLTSDKHLIMQSGQSQVPGAPEGYVYSIAQNTELNEEGNPILLRTAYISRKVLNIEEFKKWFTDQGITVHNSPHVTLCYSRDPIDWLRLNLDENNLEIDPTNSSMETFDKTANVMKFESSELSNRHYELRNLGASSDYGRYNPHITVVYGDVDISQIKPFPNKLILGPEILKEI